MVITRELSGRTAAFQVAEIRPQVDGIIKQRLFEEGAEVAAGAPLYQIDPATYQAALDSAQASLDRAQATADIARLKAQRYKELVKVNAVSRQDYDDAAATLKQAEADVASAKAAVASARINLAYARVDAPIAGRIGRSTVTQGALVTANQATALATIQQLDPIYVDVTQSSADLLRLKNEMANGKLTGVDPEKAKVTLILEDGSTYAQGGTLKFSEVTVNERTGAVTLRAQFPNPDQKLLPGMFVRAVIQAGVDEAGILVPQQGVTRDPTGNATAMVVASDDTVAVRKLEASRAIGDKWLVTAGLEPGDRVIVDGLQHAQPGAKVTPVPVKLSTAAADTAQPTAR
ncbi:efflux RND transporter periplasmic adaptor subunit [Oleomonas cavernae]|uniref:efflux RND transporter periplasmic adaptor subunit n=1 Tax=Oleomonas cavernae TaxID=2320859 RepID=UPI001F3C0DC6|nr:efflux RND transporter periplasmic adaptor subunit [Oleomonas cavernae]